MKKLFYIGALSAFLLAACGEDKAKPKEEKPVSAETEQKQEKNPVEEAVKTVIKDDYEIVESDDGLVRINIKDKKIHEGSKSQILKKSGKIFAELSKVESIQSPSIYWFAPLTDQYGNEEMGEVYGIFFDAETFKKVNWDNYEKLDLEAIAPGYKQHESLKD